MKYAGDSSYIHLADSSRKNFARWLSLKMDNEMRVLYISSGKRTPDQILEQPLCPGCCNVTVVDLAIYLAQQNGQSLAELGLTLAEAFLKVSEASSYEDALTEEVRTILDPT